MVPFITREATFCPHVRKLVLGVHILDVHLEVQNINAVKQPILSNSVCSGHVSQSPLIHLEKSVRL